METFHVAAVSSKKQGRRSHGAIAPLGLGGCRSVAMISMAQPTGSRPDKRSTHARNWSMPGALPPALAGCDGGSGEGDLPRSHALFNGTDAELAKCSAVDGEGLCLHRRINTQAGG